jgi:L-alanine-DL-glutamate epimerase-like enolase superfamily enzyme
VGKALGTPAWALIGGRGPEWVPVYDGSIYFADLLPEPQGRGIARILEEVEQGIERGHRAFKIKVGRGYKWMEKSAGLDRDVEVVRAIRRLVGPEILLMADSNNGYDLDETLRFLDAIETELFFAEEMFPEDVDLDLRLKAELDRRGLDTLVADGESAGEVDHFDPFLQANALDVLQPDIRALGLSLQWELSRRIEASGTPARLAPHNWGSNLGVFMQAVLARGIPNFLSAEWDTSTSDLFDTTAFTFRDGLLRVPDAPGCGLVLRDDVFSARYAGEAWTVSAE